MITNEMPLNFWWFIFRTFQYRDIEKYLLVALLPCSSRILKINWHGRNMFVFILEGCRYVGWITWYNFSGRRISLRMTSLCIRWFLCELGSEFLLALYNSVICIVNAREPKTPGIPIVEQIGFMTDSSNEQDRPFEATGHLSKQVL